MKWWFIFSMVLYYIGHSFLAAESVKRFLQRYLIPQRYYRLFFNAFALLSLWPVAYFYQNSIPLYLLPFSWPLRGLALLFLGVGAYILLVALRQYNMSEFSGWEAYRQPEGKSKPGVLQTGGWNSRVRHPLYFAGIVMVWGGFLAIPSDLLLAVALLTTLYSYLGARLEEEKLVKEFGETYLVYREKVEMLWPF